MSKYIKNENFYAVQGWMINELDLKGNDLGVYAIIFGFTQTENASFTGSLRYLAEFLNIDKRTVQNVLKRLLDKKLIKKYDSEINGIKRCEYTAIPLMEVLKIKTGDKQHEETPENKGKENIRPNYGKKFHGVENNTIPMKAIRGYGKNTHTMEKDSMPNVVEGVEKNSTLGNHFPEGIENDSMGIEKNSTNIIKDIKKDTINNNFYQSIKETFENNISFSALKHDADLRSEGLIDEILATMLDAYCSSQEFLSVNSTTVPIEQIRLQLMKIRQAHVQYVISALCANTTKIHNIRNYLLTAIYNAPNTIKAYYQTKVNNDMYGGMEVNNT